MKTTLNADLPAVKNREEFEALTKEDIEELMRTHPVIWDGEVVGFAWKTDVGCYTTIMVKDLDIDFTLCDIKVENKNIKDTNR